MSKCKMTVLDPESVEFKIEMVFTLRQWRAISKRLQNDPQQSIDHPSNELMKAIRSCANHAATAFLPEQDNG